MAAEEPTFVGSEFDLFSRKAKQDSCLETNETIYKPIASVDQTDIEFLIPGDSDPYEGCSKSIGPLVGKNTIIYLDVWNPNPLQSSLLGDAHTSSSGPAIAGNISGKLLVEGGSNVTGTDFFLKP